MVSRSGWYGPITKSSEDNRPYYSFNTQRVEVMTE